jgi:fructokinase
MKLGIDLGGTKIEIIALDHQGVELLRRRVATPQGDYAATLHAIDNLVLSAEAELGQRGTVGIGTPGTISRATGLLKNSNSVHLNGKPVLQDLETLLQRKVMISNDANCFALSEATDGAAAGASVVFGVIIGTGVGAGIVVNGKVLTGPNGIAGEWGHNPLPWPAADELPGPDCYCGQQGCIETFLSGPGMAKLHQNGHGDINIPVNETRHARFPLPNPPPEGEGANEPLCELHVKDTGEFLSPDVIVALAAEGDKACALSMQHYENRLARSLAHVINILDPDVIVLGGGMSNIERLYVNVPQLWSRWVFSDRVDTRLLKNKFGDSSGVRGAAWL